MFKTKIYKYILSIMILLLLVSVFTSCNNSSDVNLGDQFTLYAGKSITISSEDLEFEFIEIIGDSRCPEGVQCIWEGEATANLLIEYKDEEYTIVLKQYGSSSDSMQEFMDYKISFQINPYPQSGEDITQKNYSLVLTITK